MTLFLISLLAGVLTVLAPCILPLLPVVIGGSLTGDKPSGKKAFVIITSLAVSVIAFTLLLKASTALIDIPESFWKTLSGGIVLIFGLITLFPTLWEKMPFVQRASAGSNKLMGKGFQKGGFMGEVIMGASLGPIFTTCSPTYFLVLASVLPESFALGMVYLLAYTIGLSLSLALIAVLGQKLAHKLGVLSNPHGWFKRFLGLLFLLLGIAIISGFDKKIEAKILEAGFFDITKIEQSLLNSDSESKPRADLPMAPELTGIADTFNSDSEVLLENYRGNTVVLLDFWTYSCINCQRTIPYLNDWYDKYHDQGLEIIGVHTPEFAFEKLPENVASAIEKFEIEYPVVLDNDYATWRAFGNRYWPRKYLINEFGQIVYDHIGEGAYDETEKEIQKALKALNGSVSSKKTDVEAVSVDFSKVKSPETYFGAGRNEYLANGTPHTAGPSNFVIPDDTETNALYLGGGWEIFEEYAHAASEPSVYYKFEAKNVYVVARSKAGGSIRVFLDGELIKTVNVQEEELYQLIELEEYGEHELILDVDSNIDLFAFTFG
ncbi:MAG: cytochrome c biogenesis protein CcdA [Candidatus Paceibacterota bacterium]